MEDLLTLQGVARKTANVVLGSAFGKAEGIAVDTHVQRLSRRLGYTKQTDPVKIEADLMQLVPRDRWTGFSHAVILHGRQVCDARAPRCDGCVLRDLCPSALPEGAGARTDGAVPRRKVRSEPGAPRSRRRAPQGAA
jgi:endonuclease-3